LDLRSGDLRKQGRKIRLEGQPVQVLITLLEHPGELITREELRRELWPADTFVNFEQSLTAAVKRLRQALSDSATHPRFVETLARRGYRFIAPVAEHPVAASYPPPHSQPIDSLAVLPFENSDRDPEMEYLSDGITESIINSLSQLPAVRVMARSTVFRYKAKAADPRVIGRKLNVDAVLIGRVVQRGDALFIRTELVEVQNGWQLWGAQYNRSLSDIFAVEEEISREISEKLRLRLSGEDKSRLSKHYTRSTDAYQAYLKGRYHWNRLTEEGLRKGIECFQEAIRRDQSYALAYAGLADCYGHLGFVGLLPPKEAIPKAKEAAGKAIEIDNDLAEAHVSLAFILKVYDWDWLASGREYQRALELNPNYTQAHRSYAAYLSAVGKAEEAIREIHLAQDLDPLSLTLSAEIAWHLYMARDYDRAIEQALRTLELEPQNSTAQGVLGTSYAQQAKYGAACAALQQAVVVSENHAYPLAQLGHALGQSGRKDEAERILEQLTELCQGCYVPPCWLAMVCAGLGEKGAALQWLEKAYEQHDVWLVWLKTEPRYDSLRAEAQFDTLMRCVGLAPGLGSARTAG
jgi:TolB-like protein/Flp pilus assembly protein TadD